MSTLEEKVARAPHGRIVFIRRGLVRYASSASFDRWLARMKVEMPKVHALVLAGIQRIEAADEFALCPRDGFEQDPLDPRHWVIDISNPTRPAVRLVGPVLS